MAQEAVTEPAVGVCAVHQARDVGQREFDVRRRAHAAQVRVQRGERVRRHLGNGVREGAEERGLARVREADEPHVRDQLQREQQRCRLACTAVLGDARVLLQPLTEGGVAATTAAPARDQNFVAVLEQLGQSRTWRVRRLHARRSR